MTRATSSAEWGSRDTGTPVPALRREHFRIPLC
jgi:hypothetical protein